MDTMLIKEIFEVCIIPLLGVLTAYFVKWVNVKSAELSASRESELERKYLNMLNDTIADCVMATTQTYVDALKKQDSFDIEAQKEAFAMTYSAVMKLLTDEATEYLNTIIGDLSLYITQKIESEVKLNKN